MYVPDDVPHIGCIDSYGGISMKTKAPNYQMAKCCDTCDYGILYSSGIIDCALHGFVEPHTLCDDWEKEL